MVVCQAEDRIRDADVTAVQTCALPILEILKLPDEARRAEHKGLDLTGPALALQNAILHDLPAIPLHLGDRVLEIGRASCRERGWRSAAVVELKNQSTQHQSTDITRRKR